MTCPYANMMPPPAPTSNISTEKLSYEIYEVEAELLRTKEKLEKLKLTQKCQQKENNEKRLGTAENVEKEFNKLYDLKCNFHPGNRAVNAVVQKLKPLLTNIIYTLKNLEVHDLPDLEALDVPDLEWDAISETAKILTSLKETSFDLLDKETHYDDKPRNLFTSD